MGRQRYKGVQTFLKDGCYFLSLCSIAEDVTGKNVDIIEAINYSIAQKWARSDGWIDNPTAILSWLTKSKWALRVDDVVPSVVEDNEWTILKYYNSKTKYTHFKRRDVDTLVSSKTVLDGKIVNCYVFVEL